jgi:DNA-binding response OmpR family regulator
VYRVILVSHDRELEKSLKATLHGAGYQLRTITTDIVKEGDVTHCADVVLVDTSHGIENLGHFCHVLKRVQAFKDVPSILLLAQTMVKMLDWRWGFDEFVVMPVDGDSLLARIQFVLWRLHRVDLSNGLHVGDLNIDFEQFTVAVKGRVVDLTYKEYELIRFLASHPGKVFTREDLLSKVWGYDYYGGTRTVDVHIRRLRSKLEDAHHDFITTIRNVGYKFIPQGE